MKGSGPQANSAFEQDLLEACFPGKFWLNAFHGRAAWMSDSDDESTDAFLQDLLTCHRPATRLHYIPLKFFKPLRLHRVRALPCFGLYIRKLLAAAHGNRP